MEQLVRRSKLEELLNRVMNQEEVMTPEIFNLFYDYARHKVADINYVFDDVNVKRDLLAGFLKLDKVNWEILEDSPEAFTKEITNFNGLSWTSQFNREFLMFTQTVYINYIEMRQLIKLLDRLLRYSQDVNEYYHKEIEKLKSKDIASEKEEEDKFVPSDEDDIVLNDMSAPDGRASHQRPPKDEEEEEEEEEEIPEGVGTIQESALEGTLNEDDVNISDNEDSETFYESTADSPAKLMKPMAKKMVAKKEKLVELAPEKDYPFVMPAGDKYSKIGRR